MSGPVIGMICSGIGVAAAIRHVDITVAKESPPKRVVKTLLIIDIFVFSLNQSAALHPAAIQEGVNGREILPFKRAEILPIYYRQGKYEAALPYLDKSMRGLNRPIAHYHLAAELLRAGDTARARKEFDEAVKQAPNSPARAELATLFDARAAH